MPISHRGSALGFLGAVLLVEVLARSSFFVDRPVPLALTGMHHKAAWLDAQPPADILIVGDSTANRGIDARLFGEVAGQRTLNASYTSGSSIVMRFMLTGLAKPPKVIVFGEFPLGLSDDWPAAPHEVDAATWRERTTLIEPGEALLGTFWASYRRRTAISEWLAAHWRGPLAEREIPDDAWGGRAIETPPKLSPSLAEDLWRLWAIGEPPRLEARFEAMQSLAAQWEAQGTRVVYVLMPMASALRDVAAQHSRQPRLPLDSLHRIADPHDSVVLDARSAVPDDGFYDVDHLRKGPWRDAFTRRLAEAVRDKRDSLAPVTVGG